MSAEIQVDLLDRNMLEGHVDRVADEPGGIRDLAVDVACGDDERLRQVVECLALCAVELLRDRALFTPEPGTMPVSESCTVRTRRLRRPAASASMAMTARGRTWSSTPLTISPVSTPV